MGIQCHCGFCLWVMSMCTSRLYFRRFGVPYSVHLQGENINDKDLQVIDNTACITQKNDKNNDDVNWI